MNRTPSSLESHPVQLLQACAHVVRQFEAIAERHLQGLAYTFRPGESRYGNEPALGSGTFLAMTFVKHDDSTS